MQRLPMASSQKMAYNQSLQHDKGLQRLYQEDAAGYGSLILLLHPLKGSMSVTEIHNSEKLKWDGIK